jgi:hypothetical protein
VEGSKALSPGTIPPDAITIITQKNILFRFVLKKGQADDFPNF